IPLGRGGGGMMPGRLPHYNANAQTAGCIGMGRGRSRWRRGGRVMRRFWIVPLGIIASLISVALIVQQLRSTIDVFELADPTGNFGIYFFLGGLAANCAVLFVAVCVLLPRSRSKVRLGFAVVVFVPSLLEAIGVLPCFLSARPGALCGLGFVYVSYVSVPIVLLAAIGFVATAEYRALKVAGLALAATFIGVAAA